MSNSKHALNMARFRYFKSSNSLPSAKNTGIGEMVTKEANTAVSHVLTEKQQQQSSSAADCPHVKQNYTFSAEQRASIGRYTAEHSNAAATKKFKSDFEQGLGESTCTIRLFKKNYEPYLDTGETKLHN